MEWLLTSTGLFYYLFLTECKTSNSSDVYQLLIKRGAQIGQPCIFPFTVKNKTYHSCTYDFSHVTGYKPWCSTKIDNAGNHITGRNTDGTANWGICEDVENCPIPPRRK